MCSLCVLCVQMRLTLLAAATPTGYKRDSDSDLGPVALAVEAVYRRHAGLLIGARLVQKSLRTVTTSREVLVVDVGGGGVEGVAD